ncbi:MAG: hypothetical protein U1C47_24915 [Hydrogenophaga sp.]|nr:hypothetical protein [Hydrogenophaga sp.]
MHDSDDSQHAEHLMRRTALAEGIAEMDPRPCCMATTARHTQCHKLAQVTSTVELAQFVEGERVQFTAIDESVNHGVVLYLNKKTASLRTDEGQSWRVSPGLMCRATTR